MIDVMKAYHGWSAAGQALTAKLLCISDSGNAGRGGKRSIFENLHHIFSYIAPCSSKTKGLLRVFWQRMDRSCFDLDNKGETLQKVNAKLE